MIGLIVALGLLVLALILVVLLLVRATPDEQQSSMRTVRVDDFGAKGDGTTDDGPAIRAAVAAVRSGDTLVFSPGKTYLAAATIEVANKSRISIVASGAALTTTASSDTSSVLRVENCSDVRVTGGRLFHKNRGVRRNAADGLTINQCSDVVVRGVTVGYVYSMGIRVAGSRRVTVTGSTVDGSLADGIGTYGGQRQSARPDAAMTAGSTTLTSANSRFEAQDVGSTVLVTGAGASGGDLTTTIVSRESASLVVLAAAARTSVTNQFVKILRPSADISIVKNRLENTGDDAISSVSYLTYSGPNTGVRIQGNRVVGSRARGILLTGTAHAVVSGNSVRRVAMAGIFLVVETGSVTTWGSDDVLIDRNTVETSNTGYSTSNYPGIGAASTADRYPITRIRITNNIIRDAYSYYISVGGYSTSNDSSSTRDVLVQGNRCIGGNRNNPAIQAIKSTNVTIARNRIEDARSSAVTVTKEVAGLVVVRGNVISRFDLGKSGYPALDIQARSPVVLDNVINGVEVASGTSGRASDG